VALQPCVRDLRAEHVLFEGGGVTGIIDFGAAAVDHPAVDLARLLGDYALDEAIFRAGLRAYSQFRSAPEVTEEFVRLLARAGAVCSILRWLVRLVVQGETISDPARICERLARLLGSLAAFSSV
jgi:Ser/Thr protein kinase RdoA (MazF antagonist)